MKRVVLCLGFAIALGLGAVGCNGIDWRVNVGVEYDRCGRCGYRHEQGACPSDNWNRPRHNPPRYTPPRCDPPPRNDHRWRRDRGCR